MNLAPGGKGPGKGPKLPPESLKLGAANLNSTKLLHKDLQMEYIEIQVRGRQSSRNLILQVTSFWFNTGLPDYNGFVDCPRPFKFSTHVVVTNQAREYKGQRAWGRGYISRAGGTVFSCCKYSKNWLKNFYGSMQP